MVLFKERLYLRKGINRENTVEIISAAKQCKFHQLCVT